MRNIYIYTYRKGVNVTSSGVQRFTTGYALMKILLDDTHRLTMITQVVPVSHDGRLKAY